jgi:hypothetical protein
MVKSPYRFYTYAYLREDKTPYYIGKGEGNRACKKGKGEVKPPKNKSRIIFLKRNLTEEESFKHEIYMISVFGRKDLGTGILRNRTDGGEGSSGSIKSLETKRKLSESHRGKKLSKETKRKIGSSLKGRVHGEETILKMRKAKKGKIMSEDAKRKMSEKKLGIKLKEEHKINISRAMKGKPAHNKGKKCSEDHKKKVSKALKDIGHKPPSRKGKILNIEHKKRISKSLKEKGHLPPLHKNTKWWNDGQINKRSVECPGNNWVLGRIKPH